MEISIDDTTIEKSYKGWYVRLHVGGHMYFDSPVMTTVEQCERVVANIKGRAKSQ